MLTPEQHAREEILARIDALADHVADQLAALRRAVAGDDAGDGLTAAEVRELRERAAAAAARSRARVAKAGGRP